MMQNDELRMQNLKCVRIFLILAKQLKYTYGHFLAV